MAKRRGATDLSGIVLVDKPKGWTSHDVVAAIRRITGEGRVGHAGTLDPMATGLLVVAIGPATRVLDALQSQRKTYRATVTFGAATDTDDAEGSVIATAEVPVGVFEGDQLARAVAGLVGEHMQLPPAYSALKIDGVRSYEAARTGEVLPLSERRIAITAVSNFSADAAAKSVSFDIEVSKGTYVRAIARDLGIALGTVAHLSELRRTTSGALSADGAIAGHELSAAGRLDIQSRFIDPVAAVALPTVHEHARTVSIGREIDLSWSDGSEAGRIAVASIDGTLLAIYQVEGVDSGRAKPVTVLGRPAVGPSIGNAVCALGVFDGVHLGHQRLLESAAARAAERGIPSVAFTFDPLPEAVLRHPKSAPGADTPTQLTSLESRVALIRACGIDHVCVIPFSPDIASLSPQDFFARVVERRAHCVEAFVGADFHFGARALGTVSTLGDMVPTTVIADVTDSETGERVSSTRVRQALERGDVECASRLLGRMPMVVGEVEAGVALGRKLGAPTANVAASVEGQSLRPGVYAARVTVLGEIGHPGPSSKVDRGLQAWAAALENVSAPDAPSPDGAYPAAVFVGTPSATVGERRYVVEAHLLNAEVNLYGKHIAIELVHHVRDPKTFPTNEELAAAIASDLDVIGRALDL